MGVHRPFIPNLLLQIVDFWGGNTTQFVCALRRIFSANPSIWNA